MSSSHAYLHWWTDPSIIESIQEFAHLAGVLIRSASSNHDKSAIIVPVTLRPSKFPCEQFELVMSIQPDLNHLLDAVSRDEEFLKESLQSVLKVDDFTRRLFQLHLDSQAVAIKPKTVICLNRSDYMLDNQHGHKKACHREDTPTFSIKQVEMNTISVGLSGLCQGPIQRLHKYVHSRYIGGTRPLNIPETRPVVEAFAVACAQYGNPDAHVLFVVNAEEYNIYDQRTLEFDLWERYQIKVIRKTLEELGTEASLGTNQELFVSGLEVAVVYYRTAYSPEQYASEKDWATRQLLECSRAANCPSVALQLVGTKKIQQVLAVPGVLERHGDQVLLNKAGGAMARSMVASGNEVSITRAGKVDNVEVVSIQEFMQHLVSV